MSDYFERLQRDIGDAVARGVHRPWYMRAAQLVTRRGFVIAFAVVVVSTPAVGAVTHWFGIGAPDKFSRQSPTVDSGRALAGTSELLSLRLPDPQGGPPWGLRLVQTTRGDSCLQVGRVEGERIGSLGIDGSWNDDHLLHPFPKTSQGYDCGTNDAAGHAFVNFAQTGVVASATPGGLKNQAQARGCTPTLISVGRMKAESPPAGHRPGCPRGSGRIVFMGLLGPDATSVTYQAPDGRLEKERTVGSDGAYLLVFPLTLRTCTLYTTSRFGGYGPCGSTESMGGASPDNIGAIKAVSYKDGHICSLTPRMKLLNAYNAFGRSLLRKLHVNPKQGRLSARVRREVEAAIGRYEVTHHLARGGANQLMRPNCPAVGYVAPKGPKLSAADVKTPIIVKRLPDQYGEPMIEISFKARQPVTSSSSWYDYSITYPRGCQSGGDGGELDRGNIRAGQVIRARDSLYGCKGVYRGTVDYVAHSGPENQEGAGGQQPGSLVVGRFSVRLR